MKLSKTVHTEILADGRKLEITEYSGRNPYGAVAYIWTAGDRSSRMIPGAGMFYPTKTAAITAAKAA